MKDGLYQLRPVVKESWKLLPQESVQTLIVCSGDLELRLQLQMTREDIALELRQRVYQHTVLESLSKAGVTHYLVDIFFVTKSPFFFVLQLFE